MGQTFSTKQQKEDMLFRLSVLSTIIENFLFWEVGGGGRGGGTNDNSAPYSSCRSFLTSCSRQLNTTSSFTVRHCIEYEEEKTRLSALEEVFKWYIS